MTNYRRWRIEGGTYFFTVALANRHATTLVDHIDLLRASCRDALQRRPVRIEAMVVLPDHLHAVWTLPEGDADYSTRWRFIKTGFSEALLERVPEISRCPSRSKRKKGELGIWQRRFWEHTVRGTEDLNMLRAYCWANPVKHGLVRDVKEWPHSSFHRDVKNGIVLKEWTAPIAEGEFGEPEDAVGWVATHPTAFIQSGRSGTDRTVP